MYKKLNSTYDFFDYKKLFDNKILTIDRHYTYYDSGIITRYCEHREDETKHLSYSKINWDDIIYLDIKPITFTITTLPDPVDPTNKITFENSNFGEHVLNKVFSNSQKFYLIHYTSDPPHKSNWNNYFFDYFNKMKEPSFLIYMEYVIKDEKEIIEFENCMNTEYITSVGFNSTLPIKNVRQSPDRCDYPRRI